MKNVIGKKHSILFAAAVASWVAVGGYAGAQETGSQNPTVTYHIDFGTDFNLMMNPDDPVAQHFAMWKTPVQMASLRSAPFIRITNDSTSTMQMQSVRIDFGDPRFMFDSFAFFEQPDDGVAAITSHSDLAFMGDMEPFLQVQFPSGLNPGDSFTFQVRIANTATSQLADYESSLWHKDFAMAANREDNGLVSVVYQDIVNGSPFTLAMTPVRLFEYPLANANFATDANGASGSAIVLPNMHEMIDVGFERFSQTAVVPEPSSLALAGIAAAFGPLVVRRRRRNRR
ncbi:MAG: PEP-CTERM sorting domain-containing protein [Pirellulales bacterium]